MRFLLKNIKIYETKDKKKRFAYYLINIIASHNGCDKKKLFYFIEKKVNLKKNHKKLKTTIKDFFFFC